MSDADITARGPHSNKQSVQPVSQLSVRPPVSISRPRKTPHSGLHLNLRTRHPLCVRSRPITIFMDRATRATTIALAVPVLVMIDLTICKLNLSRCSRQSNLDRTHFELGSLN